VGFGYAVMVGNIHKDVDHGKENNVMKSSGPDRIPFSAAGGIPGFCH
jgi:hypothetical protein